MRSERREGCSSTCLRRSLLPDENPWLAYPPSVASAFSPELAALVGYRQRFAGLNNFEGQCPSVVLREEGRSFYSFADHLDDDQNARVAAYYEAIAPRAAA